MSQTAKRSYMQYIHSIATSQRDRKRSHQKTTVDVLVFDSGVGGLSIVEELITVKPNLSICFYCDNDGFPYGTKDDAWLLQRVKRLFSEVLNLISPSAIVIACNTASTIVLDMLRSQTSIPIVGVVPAIKPASALTKIGRIGLIATPATVARPYTKELIKAFASHCKLVSIGSSRLVELAETHMRGGNIDTEELAKICHDFGDKNQANVDVIVLGCTHFPLLKSQLRTLLPDDVQWIDSGAAIARQVFKVLEISEVLNNQDNTSLFVMTRNEDLRPMTPFLQGLGFAGFSHLDIK